MKEVGGWERLDGNEDGRGHETCPGAAMMWRPSNSSAGAVVVVVVRLICGTVSSSAIVLALLTSTPIRLLSSPSNSWGLRPAPFPARSSTNRVASLKRSFHGLQGLPSTRRKSREGAEGADSNTPAVRALAQTIDLHVHRLRVTRFFPARRRIRASSAQSSGSAQLSDRPSADLRLRSRRRSEKRGAPVLAFVRSFVFLTPSPLPLPNSTFPLSLPLQSALQALVSTCVTEYSKTRKKNSSHPVSTKHTPIHSPISLTFSFSLSSAPTPACPASAPRPPSLHPIVVSQD
ncbi:hypothetical protein B0H19DRAFT_1372510 [Mycena capillaripes]|nr:hypothetical protein B0H19DRAFT_1372510 [Mycena capillaripes]